MSLTKADLEQIKGTVIEVVDERVEPRFTAIDARFAAMDDRFDAMDAKIDGVKQELVEGTNMLIDTVLGHIGNLAGRVDGVRVQIDSLTEDMAVVKGYITDHDFRLAKLERKAGAV